MDMEARTGMKFVEKKRESENARAEDPLLHQPLKRTQGRPSGCD